MPKLLLVVAAALVDERNRILVAQRPEGKTFAGRWEFPGGKVEPGESPEHALIRELAEELALSVEPGDVVPLTFASHSYAEMHLLMPLFLIRRWSGQVSGNEGQALQWVAPAALHALPMPDADYPLAERLVRMLHDA